MRLRENPEHYKIDGDAPNRNLDERLDDICRKGIALLEEHDLVKASPKLQCTEFGDAMARYYLQFETMKTFLSLPPRAKVSEILSAIAQAAEFKDIRFRAGEKNAYKDLNKNGSIKFAIPVNIDAPAHKVSLIVQAVLGAVDLPTEDNKHRHEFATAKSIIFQHVPRLVRCIIDCQLYLEDAVTIRNALMLARSLGAQVWDDSPLHMKQLETVGLVTVRKLVSIGIKSIEELEDTEAHRIEMAISRRPPYGAQLQEKARAFPKLRISLKVMGKPYIKKGEHVTVNFKAEIGFLNDKIPEVFQKKAVYVCMLAETSDGHKIHFARISAKKLNKGQDVLFSANLTNPSQTVRAYVMCDEIAGTMRHAVLKPDIPGTAFPPPKTAEEMNQQRGLTAHAPNVSKRRSSAGQARLVPGHESDEFGDDADLALAETVGFVDIDDLDDTARTASTSKQATRTAPRTTQTRDDWEPRQLPNGKWACNHACKDKSSCKHLCCREGLDKQPKPPKLKESKKLAQTSSDTRQTQLSVSVTKKSSVPDDSSNSADRSAFPASHKTNESREVRDLNRLHHSIKTHTPKLPTLGNSQRPNDRIADGQAHLSFLEVAQPAEEERASTDYGMDALDSHDLPSASEFMDTLMSSRMSPPHESSVPQFDEVEGMFGLYKESWVSQPTEGNEDGRVEQFSFADDTATEEQGTWHLDDEDGEMPDMLDLAPPPTLKSRDNLQHGYKGRSLFVTQNSDSATVHDGSALQPGEKRASNVPNGITTGSNKLLPANKKQKLSSHTAHGQMPELERTMQPIMDHAFSEEVAGDAYVAAVDEQPASSDDLKKWFEAEFGTEHFNYVG